MKRLLKRILFIVTTVLIGIPLSAYVYWSTTCACDKDPAGHFSALNPLRDREPELEAEGLFQDLSAGKCEDQSLCGTALKHARVKRWRLSVRKMAGDLAILGYDINSNDGLKTVEFHVQRNNGRWKITRYSGNY